MSPMPAATAPTTAASQTQTAQPHTIPAGAVPDQVQLSFVGHVKDGLRTAGGSLAEMAEGMVKLAGTGLRTYGDLSLMGQVVRGSADLYSRASGRTVVPPSLLPDRKRGIETVRGGADTVRQMASNPGAVIDAMKKPYEDAWSAGRYGSLAGLAVVDFGDMAFGSHGAGKAGKLTKLATAVAGTAEKTADASRTIHAAHVATDAGQAPVRMQLRDVNALLREIRSAGNPAETRSFRPEPPREPRPAYTPRREREATVSAPERSHVPGAVQAIRSSFGQNTATWHLNAKGEPVRATAVLREAPTGVRRTGSEKSAQRATSDAGLYDRNGRKLDNAGHIIGHRYIANQGTKNMFPQNIHFNGAVYGGMEVEWQHWINSKPGRYVEVQVDLVRTHGQHRPDRVKVDYAVREADGSVVFENALRFNNDAHATYTPVRSGSMRNWGANGPRQHQGHNN